MSPNSIPLAANRPLAAGKATELARSVQRMSGLAPVRMSPDQFMSDLKTGLVTDIPLEGIFASQKFRNGKIQANEYLGRVIANSLSIAAWTAGGALAGTLLAPFGLPVFVAGAAGFAAGMVCTDLWDRTFGTAIVNVTKEKITDAQARPAAEAFVKYVANPIHDYAWKPITSLLGQNKVLAGAALTAAAFRFPGAAKGVSREAGKMALGTAAGLGIQLGLMDKVLEPAPHRD